MRVTYTVSALIIGLALSTVSNAAQNVVITFKPDPGLDTPTPFLTAECNGNVTPIGYVEPGETISVPTSCFNCEKLAIIHIGLGPDNRGKQNYGTCLPLLDGRPTAKYIIRSSPPGYTHAPYNCTGNKLF